MKQNSNVISFNLKLSKNRYISLPSNNDYTQDAKTTSLLQLMHCHYLLRSVHLREFLNYKHVKKPNPLNLDSSKLEEFNNTITLHKQLWTKLRSFIKNTASDPNQHTSGFPSLSSISYDDQTSVYLQLQKGGEDLLILITRISQNTYFQSGSELLS